MLDKLIEEQIKRVEQYKNAPTRCEKLVYRLAIDELEEEIEKLNK